MTKLKKTVSFAFALALLPAAALLTGCASTATSESAEGWEVLFERGDDLSKWRIAENPGSVRIEDGYIVCNGERAHAFYIGEEGETPIWNNFEAEIEFMTAENTNGGLFFHTAWQEKGWPRPGLECQINVSHEDPRKTGSVYAFGDIAEPGHEDGEWVTLRLQVIDKTVTVWVDGKQTNQWTQPDDHKLKKKRLGEGTFALQAHDPESVFTVKSLKVRHLSD